MSKIDCYIQIGIAYYYLKTISVCTLLPTSYGEYCWRCSDFDTSLYEYNGVGKHNLGIIWGIRLVFWSELTKLENK